MKGQKELGRGRLLQDPERHARRRDAPAPAVGRRRARRAHLDEPLRRDHLDRAGEDLRPLPARRARIAVGADADVVVWDPEKRFELSHKNLHMRVDYSPFEGKTVIGAPSHVFSRGELIVENDKSVGKKGRGQFVRRGTFSLYETRRRT